jgi:hypothetical protein
VVYWTACISFIRTKEQENILEMVYWTACIKFIRVEVWKNVKYSNVYNFGMMSNPLACGIDVSAVTNRSPPAIAKTTSGNKTAALEVDRKGVRTLSINGNRQEGSFKGDEV